MKGRACLVAVVLAVLPSLSNTVLQAPATAVQAASTATPNRFDPTSRATSPKPASPRQPAPQSHRATTPARPTPAPSPATVVALDPAQSGHLTSGDGAMDLDVPVGAVSASDVAAAGGKLSLLVRRVLPASGGSAGGSGHFTFGTYLVQVVGANGQPASHGLGKPLSVKMHVASRAGAVNLGHAVAVINRPLPSWASPAAGSSPAPRRSLGPTATRPATVDTQGQTLSASAVASGSSTTVSFDTVAPVAAFGAPDVAEASLSSGGLTLDYPLTLPAGPGGLTPPLRLTYDSASVADQHNVAAAAPWVGEGWHLSLGKISWAERNIAEGCWDICPTYTWGDTWLLEDATGTKTELIPPSRTTSTYYEDGNGTAITPSPVAWHTSPDTHARVISYVGPNALPGMAASPPCFRAFQPSGIMEEYGCTPDSLQFFPQPLGTNTGLDYVANWLPDLITDPRGNQVHITYQTDTETGAGGLAYPRDAVMATVEYDSPACHNAQTACTGAAWTPLMRVSFQASHSVAHVSGGSCPANGSLRCDDPVDLSASGGLVAPTVQNTFVLNDALVQARSSGGAAWNTLRSYQLAYDQSGPATITDPFSGVAQSTAGRLDLARLTEIGADGSLALPSQTFGYSQQTQLYEDEWWGPAPASNCGPSWNVGTGWGCNLWSQSYAGNSSYLSSLANGQGLLQSFTWQAARDNTRGVPSGQDVLNPFVCDQMQGTAPCDRADAGVWSRVVLTGRSESVTRLTQAGQGGAQTSTQVTGTWSYAYRLMAIDDSWGDMWDFDVEDFYNGRFMGFATVTVTNPDGSSDVHQYPSSLGWGVFDPSNAQFSGICPSWRGPCPSSPWWDPANATHGREIELDRYHPDGSLAQVTKTQYQAVCPSSGVAPDLAGNLVSELEWANPTAVCDVAPTQVDNYLVNGGNQSTAPHLTTTYTRDSYGRITSAVRTSNDGGGTGSPATIVQKVVYAWNDAVTATASSASGSYLIDFPAFVDVEDASGSRYQCSYASYDGNAYTTGQTGGLTLGEATRADLFTSCGTAANGFTPSGQISTIGAYDAFGNPVGVADPDAVAGSAAHLGCTVGSTSFSVCAAYDGTFATLPVSSTNALGQVSTTAYGDQASASTGFGLWPTATTDANQQTTAFTYDPLGRPTGSTLPGEGAGLTTTGTAYTVWCAGTGAQSPCTEIDRTQRLNGSTTVTARGFYDGLGRLVETRSPAPGGQDVVRYTLYDQAGRLAFESVPYFVGAYIGGPGASAYSIPDSSQAGTTWTYDGLGRVTSVTDALSHRATTAYSTACAPTATDAGCYEQTLNVDRDGHQSGALVDALGRTAYEQRYTGSGPTSYSVYASTRYTYDFTGNLVQVLQPDGATTTTVQYDMAGRATGLTDPDRGTESYGYDASSNVVQVVDARGSAGTTFIGYDGLDRPLWRSPQNSPTGAYATFSYDDTTAGNAGMGRLTGESFSSGSLSGSYTFAYDARGRQVGDTETVGGATYAVQTSYDDAGNVLGTTYPTGETVTNSYTGQGWLSGVSALQGGTTTSLLGGVTYGGAGGAFGDISGASVGGGTYAYSAAYDLLGRNTDLKVTKSGGPVVFDQARTFDPVGNVSTASTTLPTGTDNQAFCYDEQNRLTWAGSAGTPPCASGAITAGSLTSAQYTQSFGYDTMGRLTTSPLGAYTYGSGAPVHAATAVGSGYTASYDAAGNMTCRASTSAATCAGSTPTGDQLGYDNEGRLVSWQGGGASDGFLYDGQGRRVAQQVAQGGTTTTTVYVGGLEAVTSSGGTTTTKAYYSAGGRQIAMGVNGAIGYLASDGLGSMSVALSAGGSATASQLFAPYGGVRYTSGTMPTDYGFTGQLADSVSGLDYYRSRYYDPVAGQFTSADIVVPGGGLNLWGLSRFAYTEGDPSSLTDPTGHIPVGPILRAIAAGARAVYQFFSRPDVQNAIQRLLGIANSIYKGREQQDRMRQQEQQKDQGQQKQEDQQQQDQQQKEQQSQPKDSSSETGPDQTSDPNANDMSNTSGPDQGADAANDPSAMSNDVNSTMQYDDSLGGSSSIDSGGTTGGDFGAASDTTGGDFGASSDTTGGDFGASSSPTGGDFGGASDSAGSTDMSGSDFSGSGFDNSGGGFDTGGSFSGGGFDSGGFDSGGFSGGDFGGGDFSGGDFGGDFGGF